MQDTVFFRRREAAAYLLTNYGFGAEPTLAKGVVTGDTPEYHKAGRIVLYTREALDAWALGKIRGPVRSTSARDPHSDAPGKRGRPAGAKPISATLDRVEAAEAKRAEARCPMGLQNENPPLGSPPVRSTSERPPQGTAPGKRGRPAGAKPISATLDRVEAAEAKREAV
jgi:hypothetical protein